MSKLKITRVRFVKPTTDPTGMAKTHIVELNGKALENAAFCKDGIKFPRPEGYRVVSWAGLESWDVVEV